MTKHLEFHKYSSIENTYQKPYMDKVRAMVPSDMIWHVTEKVHGANCSFICDGNTVEFAKRSCIVGDGDGFYGYQYVLADHQERILNAYGFIDHKYGYIQSGTKDLFLVLVQFYGELFGGTYPHPEVPRDNRFASIQKGLYYAPYQSFYGFDIALTYDDGTRIYLSPEQEEEVYEDNGIFYAKTLFKGTLDECLAYPNMFQSHIPQWLGLPDIPDNICEGVVLKPAIPQYLGNGERIVLKNKNARFAEKKGEKDRKEVEPLSAEVSEMVDIIMEYITDNRLDNVISHEGEFDMPKEFGKLMKLYSEDILNDFVKENMSMWNTMEKGNQRKVTSLMNKKASEMIKKHYGITG